MAKTIIAVMGATGTQGSGVVKELLARGRFGVRVLTRSPNSDKAKALEAQGCEVVQGDLTKPETLEPAFKGAHGAFLVTNFWDPATSASETAQGTLRRSAQRGPLRVRAAGMARHVLPSTHSIGLRARDIRPCLADWGRRLGSWWPRTGEYPHVG